MQSLQRFPPFVDTVGVFVNEDQERLKEIVQHCGLNTVQLHGQESPDYCDQLARSLPSCRLLKAFRVGTQTTAADIAPYADYVQGYLLDTFQKDAVGGTGQAFDWALIERLQLRRPFLLAGGLDCDNVNLALKEVAPYGLDANSGLEDAPGVKNHQKVQAFLRLVREAAHC